MIPPEMELNGRGPLLSASKYDRDMLWARVSQLHQLSVEVRHAKKTAAAAFAARASTARPLSLPP